jgi:hypothetical protein
MTNIQGNPEQGVDIARTPQEALNKLAHDLKVLWAMEHQVGAYQQEVGQLALELQLSGQPFMVELTYPTPEADAYEIFDGDIFKVKPSQFTATRLHNLGDGEAFFANDQTGHILKVIGGYNFELSLLKAEQVGATLAKQLGQAGIKLATLNGPATLPSDKIDWH